MRLIGLLLLTFVVMASCEPKRPWWNTFSQGFIETTIPEEGDTEPAHTVVGSYSYNPENQTTRLSRSNGRYDGICSGYKNYDEINAACEQITIGNLRYVYYPDQEDCCYCCNASQGCGVLKQNWLKLGDYLGIEIVNGVQAYVWNLDEGPNMPNTLWETTEERPEDRTVLKIRRTAYEEVFVEATKTNSADGITLPTVCDINNICPKGDCMFIRGDEQQVKTN